MPAFFGVLVWLWLSYNWELQQKNIATTKTSDKSENAITKQKNSWLNFNRMHATFSSNWSTSKMFKQASLKPVEPFTIINNQGNPSQLSIISGNLHNYQQVIIPAHEGQLAALQFSPSGGKTRKYVNRLLSERPQTFWGQCNETSTSGGNVKIYDNSENLSNLV